MERVYWFKTDADGAKKEAAMLAWLSSNPGYKVEIQPGHWTRVTVSCEDKEPEATLLLLRWPDLG